MNTHPKSELDTILRLSEIHAMTCTIDGGITSIIFERQIEKGFLTISATSKMVKKAIKLYEIFLKRMYKEGCSLILDYDGGYHCPASAIIVGGEMIPIRVKETHIMKTHMDGSWVHKDLIPTGQLAIEIYGGTTWSATKTLKKPETSTWEEVIEKVIPYLHCAAKRIREARLKHEEWRRKMDEAEKARKEHEQAIEERALLAKSILEDIWLYSRAETIRKYCRMAEQRKPSESYLQKIEIARQIADWLDPTADFEDELLSERYDAADFLSV